MAEYLRKNVQLQILAVFLGMPLLIFAFGDYPQRTLLKESLSLTTILAFSLMIGLFYLARPNRSALKKISFSTLLEWHKCIGYIAVPVLLVHPFFLVLPRFFEAGVSPWDAFRTIVTTLSSNGVLFGLIAWCLLLVLALTSLLRKKLPLKYQSWRVLHGTLALICISSAACHAIDLGRHTDLAMTAFVVVPTAGGIFLLLKNYASKKSMMGGAR